MRQFFVVREFFVFLDVLPFKNDTARLVRVYGDEPCITLPEALPAPEGGTLTITELGDYCFSEKPRGLPAPEELCRYAVEPDGTARLLRAFGRDLTGASHARYDLDFGDKLSILFAAAFWRSWSCPGACGSSGAVPFTTAAACAAFRPGRGS